MCFVETVQRKILDVKKRKALFNKVYFSNEPSKEEDILTLAKESAIVGLQISKKYLDTATGEFRQHLIESINRMEELLIELETHENTSTF